MSSSIPQQLLQGILLPLMEEFYTLQGEGIHTGKPAYFIRIGGCDVGCYWCDVKESWNPELHPLTPTDQIVRNAAACPAKTVVVTGGEPLMYDLDYLCNELKKLNIHTYLETSGAYPLTGTWDWICLSPKKKNEPLASFYSLANELKIIVFEEDDFRWAEHNARQVSPGCHLMLQPEWSRRNEMMTRVIDYVKAHTHWRISLQSHKYMGIP
ncbi:MAG: 7-carboxy-7-deazaguanine synthase QueE [Bacteroidales bacterium]|nr:7-carboxy-7-deazaguanine synthase QueE [Bacteroidales bacterium]